MALGLDSVVKVFTQPDSLPSQTGVWVLPVFRWFIQVDTAAPSVLLARVSPYPGHLVPMGHPRVEASVST